MQMLVRHVLVLASSHRQRRRALHPTARLPFIGTAPGEGSRDVALCVSTVCRRRQARGPECPRSTDREDVEFMGVLAVLFMPEGCGALRFR